MNPLLHVPFCLQVAAEQLIAGTGADPALVPLAASYMRIRALAQPAVLVTMASQGGLLAQRVRRDREGPGLTHCCDLPA